MEIRSRCSFARVAALLALASLWPLAVDGQDRSLTLALAGTSAKSTAENPVSNETTGTLAGEFGLTGVLSFDLSLAATDLSATSPASGAQFGSSGGDRLNLLGGLSWSPNEHATLGAFAGGSPSSSFDVGTQFTVGDAVASALVRTDSRSLTYGVRGEFQTAGESPFESDLTLALSRTDLTVDQTLEQLDASAVVGGTDGLLRQCRNSHAAACRAIETTFVPSPRSLKVHDLAATLGYTATLAQATDITVELTHHSYSGDDPNGVGYFGGVVVGRGAAGVRGLGRGHGPAAASSTLALVGGIPLGPPETTAGAGVSHQFGTIRLGIVAGYENYFESSANEKSIGASVAVDLSTVWRATVVFTHTRGVDDSGNVVPQDGGSLTLRRTL